MLTCPDRCMGAEDAQLADLPALMRKRNANVVRLGAIPDTDPANPLPYPTLAARWGLGVNND